MNGNREFLSAANVVGNLQLHFKYSMMDLDRIFFLDNFVSRKKSKMIWLNI